MDREENSQVKNKIEEESLSDKKNEESKLEETNKDVPRKRKKRLWPEYKVEIVDTVYPGVGITYVKNRLMHAKTLFRVKLSWVGI